MEAKTLVERLGLIAGKRFVRSKGDEFENKNGLEGRMDGFKAMKRQLGSMTTKRKGQKEKLANEVVFENGGSVLRLSMAWLEYFQQPMEVMFMDKDNTPRIDLIKNSRPLICPIISQDLQHEIVSLIRNLDNKYREGSVQDNH
ncbi:hypothetical protein PPACK8108_LOCUS2131 [Phakopsora pachyrhizi]|uniref:Uncharacterized protein n=1 Tax=Phakopsora pachyrhizi TaxID=170000 RepID=A0AAV0AIC4_PHAPC|nr:hypothetical protein PPACK8108_LOCUS2131 [Phakopsora pachyrhizi]